MPEISRFFGIIIRMFHRGEHRPAHFHAVYGGNTIRINIESLSPMDSTHDLPPRVLGLVMEWAALHQRELLDNWKLAMERKPLKSIPPLE